MATAKASVSYPNVTKTHDSREEMDAELAADKSRAESRDR